MSKIKRNDWRLQNQQKYLYGVTLVYKKYVTSSDKWDHDHCAFCWAKFMEDGKYNTLSEGYVTLDGSTGFVQNVLTILRSYSDRKY